MDFCEIQYGDYSIEAMSTVVDFRCSLHFIVSEEQLKGLSMSVCHVFKLRLCCHLSVLLGTTYSAI
jgi:hypothetical protein